MNKKVHLSINAVDMKKSLEFYTALFGVEPAKSKETYIKFDLEEPALNFTINKTDSVQGNRLNHLGLQVRASRDVTLEKSRLEKLGLDTRLEEGTDCCYAIQDKVWVKDPDGNAWEVFVVLAGGKSRSGKDSKCCV